jgi:5'-nucleotidase
VAFEGLVSPANHQGVVYRDPVPHLRRTVEQLRAAGADLVVVLSHLGFDAHGAALDDLHLPGLVPGIDVIVGGHSHTFLDAPVPVSTPAGVTRIVQVGFGGINLGRMDFTLRRGTPVACSGSPVPVVG